MEYVKLNPETLEPSDTGIWYKKISGGVQATNDMQNEDGTWTTAPPVMVTPQTDPVATDIQNIKDQIAAQAEAINFLLGV